MDVLGLLSLTFQLSVALTVLGFGTRAQTDDILSLVHDARLLTVSLLAMFVVMPVVALALELYFDFPHATRVALVVLAITPIPALLPRNEIDTGGRASYAYGLAFVVAASSIVIVPALVDFLGRVMSRPFSLGMDTVATGMLIQILVPLALGMLLRRTLPNVADRLEKPLLRIAGALMSLAILVLLVLVAPALIEVATWRTVLAMAAFIVIGLGVGHAMGGPEPDQSVVLALACANRNPGLAIGIAAANFPAESFGATMILYAVLIGIVTKPYVTWQQRRLAATHRVEQGV